MTHLTDEQKQQLDDLIEHIFLTLYKDICIPDMSDVKEDDPNYDNDLEDRANILCVEALVYLKNNLH